MHGCGMTSLSRSGLLLLLGSESGLLDHLISCSDGKVIMQERELEHFKKSIAALTGTGLPDDRISNVAAEPSSSAATQKPHHTAAMSFPQRRPDSVPWPAGRSAAPQQTLPRQQQAMLRAQQMPDMQSQQKNQRPAQWSRPASSTAHPFHMHSEHTGPRPGTGGMEQMYSKSDKTDPFAWNDPAAAYPTAEPRAAPAESTSNDETLRYSKALSLVALPSGLRAQGSPVRMQSQHEYIVTEPGSQDSNEGNGGGQDRSVMPAPASYSAATAGPTCIYTETTVTRLVVLVQESDTVIT